MNEGSGDIIALVLLVLLALVAGGCVCVVWAERGGPRWVLDRRPVPRLDERPTSAPVPRTPSEERPMSAPRPGLAGHP
ncbi:hypothetical protein GT204_06645 [Streptomyces sp. SID4919]|nr:hypothetical protein [Streptomyces sp. SID4919]